MSDTHYNPCEIIFITGASRSGTTMMSRILGANHAILTLNELHILGDVVCVDRLENTAGDKELIKICEKIIARQHSSILDETVTPEDQSKACRLIAGLPAAARTYKDMIHAVMSMFSTAGSVQKVCEHTPRNIFYAKEILEAFPNAKIVHIVRDPRAVLVSQKNRWKRRYLGAGNIPLNEIVRYAVNYHPLTMAKMWQKANAMAGNLQDHSRFLVVRFEDLLERPIDVVRSVCGFTGVEFSETMLEIERVGSSNRNDTTAQKGLDKSVADQWRDILTRGEVMVCEAICAEEMNKYGYTCTGRHDLPTYLSAMYRLMLYPLHCAGVVLINPRRALIQLRAVLHKTATTAQ